MHEELPIHKALFPSVFSERHSHKCIDGRSVRPVRQDCQSWSSPDGPAAVRVRTNERQVCIETKANIGHELSRWPSTHVYVYVVF